MHADVEFEVHRTLQIEGHYGDNGATGGSKQRDYLRRLAVTKINDAMDGVHREALYHQRDYTGEIVRLNC